MVRTWIGGLAAAVALAAAGCGETATEREQYVPSDVPIAVQFTPHYGFTGAPDYKPLGGVGTWGWNIIGGTPPHLFMGFTPTWSEVGLYSSHDLEVIAWQLEQIQKAGANTLIIGWGGWGDVDLDGDVDKNHIPMHIEPTIHRILDHILDNRLPIKFTLLVVDFPEFEGFGGAKNLTDAQRQMVTDYMWNTYFGPSAKYKDIALRLDGSRPTVFASGWTDDGPGAWWRAHNFSDSRFELIDLSENDSSEDDYTSVYVFKEPPSAIPGADGIVTIWPRHTNMFTFLSGHPGFPWITKDSTTHIDPLGTEGLYDKAWKEIIEHPRSSEIRMVWIWAWNNYDELSSIEPDSGVGAYAVGDLYVRKTAHYTNLFRKGLPFEHFDEPDELSRYIGDIDYTDLNLRSHAEKDELLRDILRQSISSVAKYTRREVSTLGDMPEGLKGVTLRMAANTWRQVLAARKAPFFSVKGIVDQGVAPVVSDDICQELRAWHRSPGMRVIFSG